MENQSPESNASNGSDIDGVEFYWRPGCPFCMRLDGSLSKLGVPMNKHNIWDNPNHAATVRSIANGNETVPTVVIDGVGMVNPSPDEVIGVLADKAPHLVPAGWEPKQRGGKLRKMFGE